MMTARGPRGVRDIFTMLEYKYGATQPKSLEPRLSKAQRHLDWRFSGPR